MPWAGGRVDRGHHWLVQCLACVLRAAVGHEPRLCSRHRGLLLQPPPPPPLVLLLLVHYYPSAYHFFFIITTSLLLLPSLFFSFLPFFHSSSFTTPPAPLDLSWASAAALSHCFPRAAAVQRTGPGWEPKAASRCQPSHSTAAVPGRWPWRCDPPPLSLPSGFVCSPLSEKVAGYPAPPLPNIAIFRPGP